MAEAIGETTYVGVERWSSSGAPWGLIIDTMDVTPPVDWELIRSVLSPASATGELPPIDYPVRGGGTEFLDWQFSIPRFSALLADRADMTMTMAPADCPGSETLELSGIRIIGNDSTVSFLQSEERFISIVQIGSVRDGIGRLFELSSEQFGRIHARPRR